MSETLRLRVGALSAQDLKKAVERVKNDGFKIEIESQVAEPRSIADPTLPINTDPKRLGFGTPEFTVRLTDDAVTRLLHEQGLILGPVCVSAGALRVRVGGLSGDKLKSAISGIRRRAGAIEVESIVGQPETDYEAGLPKNTDDKRFGLKGPEFTVRLDASAVERLLSEQGIVLAGCTQPGGG